VSSNFIQNLKKARLFGHPIHAMVVHFPIACFPLSFLFDLLGIIWGSAEFTKPAFFILIAGVSSGLIAALAGAIDYFRINPENAAWPKATWHAILNFVWLITFATLAGIQFQKWPNLNPVTPFKLICSGLAVCGLFISNYLGAELIYRHGISVQSEDLYSE